MSIFDTVLDVSKKILITAVTRFATNMATKASNSFDSKPIPQRGTKSKELTTLERRYLAEKDKREQISLEIQREQLRLQAQIHKENIELSLKKIQEEHDKDHWVGILSRDETLDVLHNSQEKHHLLMLLSEPEVSPSCPDSFKHDLPIAVRNELKQFMQEEYPFQNELYPVKFFGKFFESRIFDAHVKQYERLLNSVPTVVLYSQMTDENLYLHIYGWGFGNITLTETCTFNWEAIYEQFHNESKSDKDAYKAIRKIIIALHQAFAAFCSDFYYLTVINPLHEPCLLNAEFSEELQMVVEPLKQSLQTICEQNRQRYKANLLEQELINLQEQQDVNSVKTLVIGQTYQGGIIFYLDSTKTHGLIAAPTDQSDGIQWNNWGMHVSSVLNSLRGTETRTETRTAIGTGLANTNAIIKYENKDICTGNYAAKLCADLVIGGYSDWYLPSKDELDELFENQVVVGGFANANYWSSTEAGSNSAWFQSFPYGYQNSSNKSHSLRVRAVRAF